MSAPVTPLPHRPSLSSPVFPRRGSTAWREYMTYSHPDGAECATPDCEGVVELSTNPDHGLCSVCCAQLGVCCACGDALPGGPTLTGDPNEYVEEAFCATCNAPFHGPVVNPEHPALQNALVALRRAEAAAREAQAAVKHARIFLGVLSPPVSIPANLATVAVAGADDAATAALATVERAGAAVRLALPHDAGEDAGDNTR